MKENARHIAKGLWILSLILISTCAAKQLIDPTPLRPLKGAFTKADFPSFSWSKWIDGSYQHKFEKACANNFGFHTLFIRCHNQWNFSIWRKPRVKKVTIGKDGYLFEQVYIDGLLGTDYNPRKYNFDRKKKNIKSAYENLKADGQDVVFCIMPGKAFIHPDKIPDPTRSIPEKNMHTLFMDWANKSQIEVIDFQQYFVENQDNIPYPIFPKLGIHLSKYAESIVLDSMLRYIENHFDRKLYDYHFSETTISDIAQGRDQDIGNALNLYFPLEKESLAYRNFKVDSVYSENPNLLVIGDSFYWGLYALVLNNNLFPHHEFWYRNHNAFPDKHRPKEKESKAQRAIRCIETFDMTIILLTSVGLDDAGWGYFDDLAEYYEKKQ